MFSHFNRAKGFTLVELTLVMAFMSILLLSILTMTIYAGKLYTKGVTNKTMNQIGREIFDLMKAIIQRVMKNAITDKQFSIDTQQIHCCSHIANIPEFPRAFNANSIKPCF